MRVRLLLLVCAATFAGARSAPAERNLLRRIDAEITRIESLDASLKPEQLPQEAHQELGRYRPLLAAARATKAPLLRVYQLREPFIGVERLAFVAQNKQAGTSLDRFEALWKSERRRFTRQMPHVIGPLSQVALAESGRNRAEKLFNASLQFAKATHPLNGLYYLGEAEANLRFATFVEALDIDTPPREKQPDRKALKAAIAAADAQTLAVFQKDPGGRSAIPASARLKEAHELFAAGRLAGATLTLFESRRNVTETDLADLGAALGIQTERKAQPRATVAGSPVTVTLVRWPYT